MISLTFLAFASNGAPILRTVLFGLRQFSIRTWSLAITTWRLLNDSKYRKDIRFENQCVEKFLLEQAQDRTV